MEHKIIAVPLRSVSDTLPLTQALPEILNDHAAEGWELVTAHATADGLSASTLHVFVMRREKPVAPNKGKGK